MKDKFLSLQVSGNNTLGQQALESRGLNFDGYFYWISIGALIGFTIVLNVGFTLALEFFKCMLIFHFLLGHTMKPLFKTCTLIQFSITWSAPGRSRALVSNQKLSELQGNEEISGKIGEGVNAVGSSFEIAAKHEKSEQFCQILAFLRNRHIDYLKNSLNDLFVCHL